MRVALAVAVLLAGCMEPTGGEEPFLPQEERTTSPEAPGVVVEGEAYRCGEDVCLEVEGRNEGNDTYDATSYCDGPWHEELRRGEEELTMRKPTLQCGAFMFEDFAPGDARNTSAVWNGTFWVGHRYEPVPPGTYEWTMALHLYEDRTVGERHELGLSFTVPQ